MSLVSIIIVNYNGKRFLKDCFSSLKASDAASAEVVLVDNASGDGSAEYVRQEFPSVKVVPLDKNYGFAQANNIGVESASGTYLVFLNNDTVVTPRWLGPLVASLSSDPSLGVVGSKLMFHDDPQRVNSAGATIMFNGAGYDIGFGDLDSGTYDVGGLRGAVCGAAMMVRRKDFLSLGGFDPRYFMYSEDTDLCWRYWLSGFTVRYVPDSVVYHKFGGTSGSDRHTPLRVFYSTRNSMLNIFKNYEFLHIWVPFLVNILYHAVKFFLFCATGRFRSAGAVLRAYRSLFKLLPYIRRQRKEIQTGRRIKDRYLFKNALIVSLPQAVREFFRLIRT